MTSHKRDERTRMNTDTGTQGQKSRSDTGHGHDHADHDHDDQGHSSHLEQDHASHVGHDHASHIGHDHGPGGHVHAVTANSERKVLWAMLLTGAFMFAEVIGGVVSGSLALIADAGHMLTDFASLALAWFAFRLARRPVDLKRSYGYHRFQVLAAFVNGISVRHLSLDHHRGYRAPVQSRRSAWRPNAYRRNSGPAGKYSRVLDPASGRS